MRLMHEMGVAIEICRLAEQHAGVARARLLSRVAVIVGDDAGIEPSSLEFCLGALLAQPPFAGAAVEIKRVNGDALRLEYLEIDDERPSH
jgi:Zn finger protein HypA/HybF involved in hydrogenase expression